MIEVIYLNKVSKFVLSLKNSSKNRIITLVDMLEEHGNLIEMPYSKSLGNGLFELRFLGEENIRIIYCFHKNKAYLLHSFLVYSKSYKFLDRYQLQILILRGFSI